jgi:hypothetical protein
MPKKKIWWSFSKLDSFLNLFFGFSIFDWHDLRGMDAMKNKRRENMKPLHWPTSVGEVRILQFQPFHVHQLSFSFPLHKTTKAESFILEYRRPIFHLCSFSDGASKSHLLKLRTFFHDSI